MAISLQIYHILCGMMRRFDDGDLVSRFVRIQCWRCLEFYFREIDEHSTNCIND